MQPQHLLHLPGQPAGQARILLLQEEAELSHPRQVPAEPSLREPKTCYPEPQELPSTPGEDTSAARGVQRNKNQAPHFHPKSGRSLSFALRLSVQPEELHQCSTLTVSDGEEN